MQVPADSVVLAAHDQTDFTVRLESRQAIDNVAAGFLELFCPVDVVFLVKARL